MTRIPVPADLAGRRWVAPLWRWTMPRRPKIAVESWHVVIVSTNPRTSCRASLPAGKPVSAGAAPNRRCTWCLPMWCLHVRRFTN